MISCQNHIPFKSSICIKQVSASPSFWSNKPNKQTQTLQFSFSNWESQCNSMQQINATAQFIFIHSLHSLHPCHLDVLTPFFTLLAMPWSLHQDCSSEQINCSDPHPIHPSLIWGSKQSLLVSAEKASTSKMTTEKLQSALIYHQLKSS